MFGRVWLWICQGLFEIERKNEVMLFASIRIDLEIVILSEVSQTEKNYLMIFLICVILKRNGTNELIYKTETEYRLRERTYGLWGVGEGWGEGIGRVFGIDMYTLLYLKWITNKDLLYSTGNSVQCYVAVWMRGEFGGDWIHVYVWLSPFDIHLNLSKHC